MRGVNTQFWAEMRPASWLTESFSQLAALRDKRVMSSCETPIEAELWLIGPKSEDDRRLFLTGYSPRSFCDPLESVSVTDNNTLLARARGRWYKLKRLQSAQYTAKLLDALMSGNAVAPIAAEDVFDELLEN